MILDFDANGIQVVLAAMTSMFGMCIMWICTCVPESAVHSWIKLTRNLITVYVCMCSLTPKVKYSLLGDQERRCPVHLDHLAL